jgi:hypothetical protein
MDKSRSDTTSGAETKNPSGAHAFTFWRKKAKINLPQNFPIYGTNRVTLVVINIETHHCIRIMYVIAISSNMSIISW